MKETLADAIRRALEASGIEGPASNVRVRMGRPDETEEDAIVRAVLEEPSDTVTVTLQVPMHVEYVRLQLNIDGPDKAE